MRPDSINIALFVHVLGAMVLVGGLLTAAAAAIIGWSDEAAAPAALLVLDAARRRVPRLHRDARRSAVVEAKEHLDDLPDDPAWLGIGYITADGGGFCSSSR